MKYKNHPISSLDYANIEDFNNLELNMINSLCEDMSICVWRNGKSYSQSYINGIAQNELIIKDSSHESGMKVTIKPNSNIFENLMWNKEMIEDFINKNASKYIKSIISSTYFPASSNTAFCTQKFCYQVFILKTCRS